MCSKSNYSLLISRNFSKITPIYEIIEEKLLRIWPSKAYLASKIFKSPIGIQSTKYVSTYIYLHAIIEIIELIEIFEYFLKNNR